MGKGGKHDMGNLFVTFLLIVIGLALTPTVGSSVETAVTGPPAMTGAALALINLVPLFWVIIILAIGIAAVYLQMKGGW